MLYSFPRFPSALPGSRSDGSRFSPVELALYVVPLNGLFPSRTFLVEGLRLSFFPTAQGLGRYPDPPFFEPLAVLARGVYLVHLYQFRAMPLHLFVRFLFERFLLPDPVAPIMVSVPAKGIYPCKTIIEVDPKLCRILPAPLSFPLLLTLHGAGKCSRSCRGNCGSPVEHAFLLALNGVDFAKKTLVLAV